MKEHIVHRLVGYDPVTDLIAFEHDIPQKKISFAKNIAHVGPGDPDAIASYPLSKMSARDLAGALHVDLPARDLDFFLEPFAL